MPAAEKVVFISSGVTNLSQSCVPAGTKRITYSPSTMAAAYDAAVRLMVLHTLQHRCIHTATTTHTPTPSVPHDTAHASVAQSRQATKERLCVRHMLHHLAAYDQVKAFSGAQLLGRAEAVAQRIGGESAGARVVLRRLHRRRGGIQPRHSASQPRQGLGKKAACRARSGLRPRPPTTRATRLRSPHRARSRPPAAATSDARRPAHGWRSGVQRARARG